MNQKVFIMALFVVLNVISLENEGVSTIPNPASVYCVGLGYEFKILTDEDGGQYGVVVFPDGSECSEWEFFTGKCGREFTYCEKYAGGKIEITTEGCTFAPECAECLLPDGTRCLEWEFFIGECCREFTYCEKYAGGKIEITTENCLWPEGCPLCVLPDGTRCLEWTHAGGGCGQRPASDKDGDGVPDNQDNCYNPECNMVDSKGCPLDSDGDGFNDCEDSCPSQPDSSNNGCPAQGFCLGSAFLSILLLMGLSLLLRKAQ
ncbi:MAG: DUF333 domain-containing protein [Theionarchaea archaeon]|nr:DUF333 domain-containing protein [Theionarchaea archaeon]